MRSRVVRVSFVAMLIAFVGLATVVKTHSVSDDRHVEVESFVWGITSNQALKICVAHVSPHEPPTERIALYFFKISDRAGQTVVARDLPVPIGEFRCSEFSHSFLIAAGLVPQENQRVQLLITVARSVDESGEGRAVGSIETIRVDTRETQVHSRFSCCHVAGDIDFDS